MQFFMDNNVVPSASATGSLSIRIIKKSPVFCLPGMLYFN